MFELSLFLAYWWMRATDQLGPMLSRTGLITGTLDSTTSRPSRPPREPRPPREARPPASTGGGSGSHGGKWLDKAGDVLNTAGGRAADWIDRLLALRDRLAAEWRRGVDAAREQRRADLGVRPTEVTRPDDTPPARPAYPLGEHEQPPVAQPRPKHPNSTKPSLGGVTMTAPTSKFTADDVKVDDVEAFYRQVLADHEVLVAGLTARNMDADTLGELAEFSDRALGNIERLLERHGAIREAVQNAKHAADTPAYTAR